MKKLTLLMTILGILLINSKVNAQTFNFYEAEKIDNIYTKSVKNGTAHFQKARFFRRTTDNKAAYCIEPFEFFNEGSNYEGSINPSTIDQNTWRRMSQIAYFGYNYQNHTDTKWYAITQLMIWQTAEKNADFYFTDYLNGNKIERFTNEINEINSLINEDNIFPSFSNQEITIKEGTNFIVDNNNVINKFIEVNNQINITDNKLDTSKLKEGTYDFKFKKTYSTDKEPVLFYYNPTSQNLMTGGNLNDQFIDFKVKVYKTEINLNKVDSDTKTTTPSGEGKLNDAVFELYDQNKKLIKEIKLNEKCEATITNLDLGTYYIKEKKSGKGYLLDSSYHKIDLTLNNPKITIQLQNKIIEKEISIHKEYGIEGNTTPEENITFEIYHNNELYKTITTDKLGNAKIKLPYGKYTFKQKNSTNGYKYIEDFNVIVNESTDKLAYNLFDYKVKVPNTRSNNQNNLYLIMLSIIAISIKIYAKEKHNN